MMTVRSEVLNLLLLSGDDDIVLAVALYCLTCRETICLGQWIFIHHENIVLLIGLCLVLCISSIRTCQR